MSKEMQIEELSEILEKACRAKPIEKCIEQRCHRCRAEMVIEADYCKQSELTPCDLCKFNPPSSGDGKPCFMCPAQRFEEGEGES